MTLLEMVVDILSDSGSDVINSISDTEEAQQVAQILKSTYYEMMAKKNWPHLRKLTQLDTLSDPTLPNVMQVPAETKEIVSIAYDAIKLNDTKSDMATVYYLPPDEFLAQVNTRDSSKDEIDTITINDGAKLLIYNDRAATCWTSFDEFNIIFDSYNSDVDVFMLNEKSQVILFKTGDVWLSDDSFTPNLPAEFFPALLAEAKSIAFYVLKQELNEKAEQQSKRQQVAMATKGNVVGIDTSYEGFGRKGRL